MGTQTETGRRGSIGQVVQHYGRPGAVGGLLAAQQHVRIKEILGQGQDQGASQYHQALMANASMFLMCKVCNVSL